MNFLPVDLIAPSTLVHKHFKLDLPKTWTQSLQSIRTKSLVLGIRPQHLSIGTKSESSIQVTVDLVEALGNETYISAHLTADPQAILTVSLPPEQLVALGDRVWLAVDLNKIHLFTVDDERAIVNK